MIDMDINRYVTYDKLFDIERDAINIGCPIEGMPYEKSVIKAVQHAITEVVRIMESRPPEGEKSILGEYIKAVQLAWSKPEMTQEEIEQRKDEKQAWVEANPTLNELMWDVSRATGNVARTRDDTTNITRGDVEGEECYTEPTVRENNIFNLGVEQGALGMLDQMWSQGYAVFGPCGTKLKREEPAKTYASTYYDFQWGVNT